MANEFIVHGGIIALNNSQVTGSLSVSNGITGSLFGTASWAVTASYAMNVPTTASYANNANSASYALTASYASNVPTTASYANFATSASYASTASYVVNAISASYALTASYVNPLSQTLVLTGSLRVTGSTTHSIYGNVGINTANPDGNLNVIGKIRTSYAENSSNITIEPDAAQVYINANSANATSADRKLIIGSTGLSLRSLGTNAAAIEIQSDGNVGINTITNAGYKLDVSGSVRFTNGLTVTGSVTATSFTGSLLGTASYATQALSASYWSGSVLNATSASYAATALSASYATQALSASYAATSSYANNFTVAGTLTAQTIVVQTITSSTDYVTGSSRFGSTTANTHQFTGSVSISGSLAVNGSSVVLSSQTGSMSVSTASYAVSSSYTVTSSYAVSSSYTVSSSYALSASYASQSISASYAATSSFANTFKVQDSLNIDSASIDYQQNLSISAGSYATVVSVATGSYRAAFFDYVAISGSASRTGVVSSIWSGSVTEYNEYSTNDLGGNTSGLILRAAINVGNIELQASSSAASWVVRSLVRLL